MWTSVGDCRTIIISTMLRLNRLFGRTLLFGATCTALMALNGCAHPVAKKLQGRWLGDSVENFDTEDIAVATGWVRGTSFEFAGSALTITVPAEEPRRGQYKVASAHEGEIVLNIENDDASRHARFTLDDEHLMRWHLDDVRSVVLRRER